MLRRCLAPVTEGGEMPSLRASSASEELPGGFQYALKLHVKIVRFLYHADP